MPVALLAQSSAPADILQHVRSTLAQFSVPLIERTIDVSGAIQDTLAELEFAGAALYIVANTETPPLSSVIADRTGKPVLAIPLETATLTPLQALQATTAGGAPVASLAIGKAGAINAALLAVAILANSDRALFQKLEAFRASQTAAVLADRLE
jgi:5-(carboxyamino)imidazole ribonucleotide mutase